MPSNYDKLKTLLAELFQYDRADLDFGIYRIMNQKRDEITRFLDADLLPQVRAEFTGLQSGDRGQIEAELQKAIDAAKGIGVDPESTPKVQELRQKYASTTDLVDLENTVFSDLYNFFRRYYADGDFLSLRRYKAGVYAIPYEGEEVKLHWANADQYYVKSSENFRDYAFKLGDGRRVHFRLVSADTERDNTKAQSGKERRFALAADEPVVEENGELTIRFEYRPHGEKQTMLNETAAKSVLESAAVKDWKAALSSAEPTEKNPKRTLLERHLSEYTARNTFDYFIHKDLGGFLRRELDFFIKNEIIHLDDIESESAPRVESWLNRVRVFRKIAGKIIDFLAQLENFQKRLWLKKKFVVDCGYCVTLDRVPEELYPEIAANDAQREEWVRLFGIDEIEGDTVTLPYSNPLTVEFLKSHPFLVLDTKFFPAEFTDRLLASFENIDRQLDGLIIHSENFQALNFLTERYRRQVKCVYIDPPYNTGGDGFAYKDRYEHSSWLAMSTNRITLAEQLINLTTGSLFISIDDNEMVRVTRALEESLGILRHATNIIWQKVDSPNDNKVPLTPDHEYVICFSADPLMQQFQPMSDPSILEAYRKDQETGRLYRDRLLKKNGANSLRSDRPTMYFPITDPDGNDIYPLHDDGAEACWALGTKAVQQIQTMGELIWKRRVVAGTERWEPYTREYAPAEPTRPYPTIWLDVKTMRQAKAQLRGLFGDSYVFATVKPTQLLERILALATGGTDTVLDFFAGSGTTAHAVINLNRESGEIRQNNGGGGDFGRRYILVEMGEYFETVLKPRIQKVVYSKDWKEGKPVSRQGSSHMFKYLRLESYEDTLNNLQLQRTQAQTSLLDANDRLREEYVLGYMLDVESRGSLLPIDRFTDPFNYTLDIATGSAGESRRTNVDLVETFNYLIGLTVRQRESVNGYVVVRGTTPSGDRTLIIWRNTVEKSNADLEEFFRKQAYNTRDLEFDLIYINGDNNLENLRRDDETWKVRLIEEEFSRRMFADKPK